MEDSFESTGEPSETLATGQLRSGPPDIRPAPFRISRTFLSGRLGRDGQSGRRNRQKPAMQWEDVGHGGNVGAFVYECACLEA